MTLIKARSRGINLADTFAFSGTVSGAGGGKINQVLSTTIGSEQSTTSSSFGDITGLSQAITPTATTSKILVQSEIAMDLRNGGGNSTFGTIRLLKDSTQLERMDSFGQNNIGNGNPDKFVHNGYHTFLDSPSSTSALTYKYQFFCTDGTLRIGVNSKITLMEVLA